MGCGRYEGVKEHNHGNFVVTNLSNQESKILPLFTDYPILGNKALDLADFRKIVEIVKMKGHLTQVGLEEIRRIKAGMSFCVETPTGVFIKNVLREPLRGGTFHIRTWFEVRI